MPNINLADLGLHFIAYPCLNCADSPHGFPSGGKLLECGGSIILIHDDHHADAAVESAVHFRYQVAACKCARQLGIKCRVRLFSNVRGFGL